MALRSAVAPLLIVLLASPARAATSAPASTPSTPARSPGTTSAPTTSGPATSAPTTSGPLTAPVTTGRESTGPVAVPAAPASELAPEASAEALYNAGEQAYWLGDFRRAVDLFEAAYARSGLPALLYNVGLATMRRYELTQDPEDLRRARAVLTNYAQELTRDPSLQQADNVPRLIAQLDATLAGLTAPGPSPAPRPAAITPATAPPPSTPIARVEMPASISSTIHTMPNTIVWPKSGCFISSAATSAVSTPVRGITGRSASFDRIDRNQAVVTMKKGFRNSEGWTLAKPKPIQRRAPLISAPKNAATATSTMHTAVPRIAMRRARFTGSIDTTSSTGTDTPTHTAWRQK